MNDELYQVPLGEFIAARDALAARLKAAGDKDRAAEAKRTRKPSVPAWAANQVVWHARDEWDRLRKAAHSLRQKHEKGAPADALRDASREQREALQACEARAARLLTEHGHSPSPAVLQKVIHTLLALAYGAKDAMPGRLEHELPPPGFEALAGLTLATPAPAEAPSRSAGKPEAPRAKRRAAVAEAEARHAQTRREVLKARARLDGHEARRASLEKELDAMRRPIDEARAQLEAAEAQEAAAEKALAALRAEKEED